MSRFVISRSNGSVASFFFNTLIKKKTNKLASNAQTINSYFNYLLSISVIGTQTGTSIGEQVLFKAILIYTR